MLNLVLTALGGILGSVFTLAIQQYRLERSEDSILISEHIKDLERLSEASLAYWLTDPSETADTANLVRLNTSVTKIRQSYKYIRDICDTDWESYCSLMMDVYKSATGGDYESKNRKINPVMAQETINYVNSLIVFLLKIRRNQSSSGVIFSKIIKYINVIIYKITKYISKFK